MGQVWSKASFDGTNKLRHLGGRGSVLAVTAQNPGSDGIFETSDDLLAPLNSKPASVSVDANPGDDCKDPMDRVRGFYSVHHGGANFVLVDSSVKFITDDIAPAIYRAFSSIAGADSP